MQKDMDELRSALLQSEQVKQNLIDQLEKKVDLILTLIQKETHKEMDFLKTAKYYTLL